MYTETTTVQYALTLRARDGRWEVAAVDRAPQLEQQTSGSPGGDELTPGAVSPETPDSSTDQEGSY